MSEADWWLCSRCSSLNNLSASKCYSCRQRKPKVATRASEVLGYVPAVSWDGKVTFRDRPRAPEPHEGQDKPVLPPLREPVPRDIVAVAPRPPNPARITYRDEPPLPMSTLARTPGYPPTGWAPPYGPTGPGSIPPDFVGPAGLPPRPMVAVGPGPAPAPESAGPAWPHWRELLDGPMPHAERLRASRAGQEDPFHDEHGAAVGAIRSRNDHPLSEAIRAARGAGSSPAAFSPWPEADLRGRRSDGSAEDAGTSPLTQPAD